MIELHYKICYICFSTRVKPVLEVKAVSSVNVTLQESRENPYPLLYFAAITGVAASHLARNLSGIVVFYSIVIIELSI